MSVETSTVPLVQVEVTFDPDRSPALQVEAGDIPMQPGLGMIEFKLSGNASFLTHPLQWLQSEVALAFPPPFMRIARMDTTTVVVTSDNRSPMGQAKSYPYMLLAFSGGKIYSTDPTIINIPPGSG